MANITKVVWDIISNDISIRKDLLRGLINVRALAKFIIKNYNIKASLDSVISAIRRFETDESFNSQFKMIHDVLKGSKLTTRTNICCITMHENPANISYISKLIERGNSIRDESLRIAKGQEFLKIIFTQDYLETVKTHLKKDSIISIEKDLAEMNIFLNEDAIQTKGLMGRVSNEIANHGINIIEIITCLPELLIFVRQPDLLKSHEAVYNLISAKTVKL